MRFYRGDRVVVTMQNGWKEVGGVAYVRYAPPSYTEIEAVSVVLDSKIRKLGYSGTIVAAEQVELIDNVIKRIAVECATEAVTQGCTPEHFTEGWTFSCGDVACFVDALGCDLTHKEWQLALRTFARTVRGHFEEVSDETDS